MYDPKSGAYYFLANERFAHEGKYRFESTYYIRYNAKKALYAFDLLREQAGAEAPDLFLCHVYLDLLLDACGMLRKWFNPVGKLTDERRQQVQSNLSEYEVDKDNYPILMSIHKARNFVEHIDERDDRLIEDSLYNGTFNVVYKGMDQSIRSGICDSSKPQNNVLNLEDMTYTVLTREDGNVTTKSVNLQSLKDEVTRLSERAELIWVSLTSFSAREA